MKRGDQERRRGIDERQARTGPRATRLARRSKVRVAVIQARKRGAVILFLLEDVEVGEEALQGEGGEGGEDEREGRIRCEGLGHGQPSSIWPTA